MKSNEFDSRSISSNEVDRRRFLAAATAVAGGATLALAGCEKPVEPASAPNGGGEAPEEPNTGVETTETESSSESKGDIKEFDKFSKSAAELIAQDVITHMHDEGLPAFMANYGAMWNGTNEQTGARQVNLSLKSTMVHDPENPIENPDRLVIKYFSVDGIDDILNVTEDDINRVIRDYEANEIAILRFPAHSSESEGLSQTTITKTASGENLQTYSDEGDDLDFDDVMAWAERLVEQIENVPDY